MKNIVITTPVCNQSYGGPFSAMVNFNNILRRKHNVSTFGMDQCRSSWQKLIQLIMCVRRSDLVVVHMFWGLSVLIPTIISIVCKKNVVIVPHGSLIDGRDRDKFVKVLWLAFFRRLYSCKFITFHALSAHEECSLHKLRFYNTFIVPNFVNFTDDPQKQLSRVKSASYNSDNLRLVYFGRIAAEKRLELILDVISTSPLAKDIQIDVIGDLSSPFAKSVHARYAVSPNIHFLGRLENEEIIDRLNSYDFSVLPSKSECLSMSLIESISCGVPVLITPGCNFDVIVDFVRIGFEFDSTPGAFLSVLDHCKKLADGERATIASNCRKVSSLHYSKKIVGIQYLEAVSICLQ